MAMACSIVASMSASTARGYRGSWGTLKICFRLRMATSFTKGIMSYSTSTTRARKAYNGMILSRLAMRLKVGTLGSLSDVSPSSWKNRTSQQLQNKGSTSCLTNSITKKKRIRGPRIANKPKRREQGCARLPKSRALPLRRYSRISMKRSRRCSRRFRSSD